jgi:hypothetical protein
MSDGHMNEGSWVLPLFVAVLAATGVLIALLVSLSR